MSYGQCPMCKADITIEEYNFAKYTNLGDGGLCGPCTKKQLESIETLKVLLISVMAAADEENPVLVGCYCTYEPWGDVKLPRCLWCSIEEAINPSAYPPD
jgi:hypothetical protein